jgi:hypothetical protein
LPTGVGRYRERVLLGSPATEPGAAPAPPHAVGRGIVHAQPHGAPFGRAPHLEAAIERLYADAMTASVR